MYVAKWMLIVLLSIFSIGIILYVFRVQSAWALCVAFLVYDDANVYDGVEYVSTNLVYRRYCGVKFYHRVYLLIFRTWSDTHTEPYDECSYHYRSTRHLARLCYNNNKYERVRMRFAYHSWPFVHADRLSWFLVAGLGMLHLQHSLECLHTLYELI